MQPGLTRAVPMGIIGFMAGAALVLLLRALQSMNPLWDAQVGIILAGLFAAIFFLWGVGAFSSKLAYHHMEANYDDEKGMIVVEGAHHDEDHTGPETEADAPRLLTAGVWQVAFWMTVLMVVIFLFASYGPGPSLTISGDPAANTSTIGYFTMQIGSQEIVVSQLTAFILLAAITVLSLAVIGGVIGLVFFNLSREVAAVKVAGNVPLNALPSSSVAGLLTGGEGEAVSAAAVRSNSNKARAFVVPNMLYYALIYPNVVLGLSSLGIGGNGLNQLMLGALISLVLTLLLLNLLKTDPQRRGELAPVRVLGIGLIVLIAVYAVFAVLIGIVTQASTWLFIPAEPVVQNLPLLNAIFLTPFILDLIFNGGRTPAQMARFIILPALIFNILYVVFYGALVGMVFPLEPLRTLFTVVSSAVVALLLLHTGEVLWCIGKFAAGIVWVLRQVPEFIGQK